VAKSKYSFRLSNAEIGDIVPVEIIQQYMDDVPPVHNGLRLKQLGEIHSYEIDPVMGISCPTYPTFAKILADVKNNLYRYCGNCFYGETWERWNRSEADK
jgi:hypothetical protein